MQYSVASDLGLYCLWHWSDAIFHGIWSGTSVYNTDQMTYSAASDLGLYFLWHWSDVIFRGIWSGTSVYDTDQMPQDIHWSDAIFCGIWSGTTLIRCHTLRHLIWDYIVYDTDQMQYSAASDLGLYCLGHWSDAIFCGIWSGTILFRTLIRCNIIFCGIWIGTILFRTLIRCNILRHLIWDYTVYDTDQMQYSAASDLGL